ncbi:AAA family ATPase [Mycolicibacterium celeriflavum]|uniref:Uncharacterized protein n=1 Tax=Mycolicibacterium celeriflavum TaxID=1249101 RepID=A0A1X0BL63_MYCCF|nr:AAA family ATPase [Mycolicibacterium celeriflavum]MCV7240445.1 AAA family ATPase [Mycolicibacterium celeriflavum]ORA43404.1 hypothetical protein BST21_21850 [Mycolicibacterium celeriflavum]BBY43588.1 hypothetical protein MCEL_18830 [Mycolicibacterium celeriflavum]
MSIDVAKRFPRTTLKEAYEQSRDTPPWIFHETICSSLTMIYGRSNVGKSYLVSSMLLSLIVEDREFLDMQPDKSKLWRPAILWTDPGSNVEYAQRLYRHLPPGESDAEVPMFHVGRTVRQDEWDALTDHVMAEGLNFIVVDNLAGITGDTSDPSAMTTVFDGLTQLTNRGVAVVVIHHESEHGWSTPGSPPMGLSTSTQKARTWIQVRQTARRKLRGGNTALIIRSNGLEQAQQLVAEPMAGPVYRVLNRGPWDGGGEAVDKPKQQRTTARLDTGAQLLAWLNDNCRGMTLREASAKLAAGEGITDNTAKQRINRAGIRKDGDGWVQPPCTQRAQ